ncbi:hypothetical protein [Streptomyces sp. NPDC127036]|uniref:hypothetical protein n=1 Tax=Streptomyces sp. NPDC127036 TaxID=3347112 RepID=UPI00364D7905
MNDKLNTRIRESAMLDIWDEISTDEEVAYLTEHSAEAAERMVAHMRGLPFLPGPRLTPVRPVVLRDEVRIRMEEASAGLVKLIERACWSLTDDPAVLRDMVGLSENQVPLLNAGGPAAERERAGLLARPDVVIQQGRPKFLECNFGTADAGPTAAHQLTAAYASMYRTFDERRRRPGAHEPFVGRMELFNRLCIEQGLPRNVAVLGTLREENVDDSRYFNIEPEYLRSHGFESRFFEPEEFARCNPDDKWSVVINAFISGEWRRMGIPLAGARRAYETALVASPDSGRVLSSKLILAWLSEGKFKLSADDAALVDESIPWTRLLGSHSVVHQGREQSASELALRQRENLVLKPIGAFGGHGVLLGRHTDPEEWRSKVKTAASDGGHIIQELVESDHLAADFHDAHAGKVVRHQVSYVLGPYIVGGKPSGYMVRHAPSASPSIVNFDRGASFNLGI